MQKTLKLTEGKIGETLLRFALPFLLANLLQALYGAVDLLVVGQFCNSEGVSAVSTGSQIMMLVTSVIIGFTMGGTILIGQYTGAGRDEDSAGTVGTIIVFFSIMAVALSIAMTTAAAPLAALMKAPVEAFDQTVQYIFFCSCVIVFITGFNAVRGILSGIVSRKCFRNPWKFSTLHSLLSASS